MFRSKVPRGGLVIFIGLQLASCQSQESIQGPEILQLTQTEDNTVNRSMETQRNRPQILPVPQSQTDPKFDLIEENNLSMRQMKDHKWDDAIESIDRILDHLKDGDH